tara:strand:+ start:374 stop:634 length:261 start_codon:yes stop_codon:yes gene_type:complete
MLALKIVQRHHSSGVALHHHHYSEVDPPSICSRLDKSTDNKEYKQPNIQNKYIQYNTIRYVHCIYWYERRRVIVAAVIALYFIHVM